MSNSEPFATLLSMSEDDLLEMLGRDLLGESREVGTGERGRRIRAARDWLEEWLQLNRQLICQDERIKRITRDTNWSGAEDAGVLADIILDQFGLPTAATVGVILAKRGIRLLCPEDAS